MFAVEILRYGPNSIASICCTFVKYNLLCSKSTTNPGNGVRLCVSLYVSSQYYLAREVMSNYGLSLQCWS